MDPVKIEELCAVWNSNSFKTIDDAVVEPEPGQIFLFCISVRVPWNPLAGGQDLEREEHHSCGVFGVVPCLRQTAFITSYSI
jgi:hypothetical protein